MTNERSQNSMMQLPVLPDGFNYKYINVYNQDTKKFESKPRELGSGEGGSVYLCQYSGTDPKIISLRDPATGNIAVKIPSGKTPDVDMNEEGNIIFLGIKNKNKPNSNIANQTIIEKNGQKFIAAEYVSYGPEQSDSLQGLIQKAGKAQQTFIQDRPLGTAIVELTTSLVTAQDALHAKGLFHLDSAARNFLVTNQNGKLGVKLTDLGLSAVIGPEGTAKIEYQRNLPLRAFDEDMMKLKEPSITSELFSRRTTMMEVLALSIGKTADDVLCLNKGENVVQTFQSRLARDDANKDNPKYNSNRETMKSYMENLKNQANELDKSDPRKAIVDKYLECYGNYLQNLPLSKPPHTKDKLDKIRNRDIQHFTAATKRFENELQKIHDANPGIWKKNARGSRSMNAAENATREPTVGAYASTTPPEPTVGAYAPSPIVGAYQPAQSGPTTDQGPTVVNARRPAPLTKKEIDDAPYGVLSPTNKAADEGYGKVPANKSPFVRAERKPIVPKSQEQSAIGAHRSEEAQVAQKNVNAVAKYIEQLTIHKGDPPKGGGADLLKNALKSNLPIVDKWAKIQEIAIDQLEKANRAGRGHKIKDFYFAVGSGNPGNKIENFTAELVEKNKPAPPSQKVALNQDEKKAIETRQNPTPFKRGPGGK